MLFELKAGTKFPNRLSPEKDLFQSTLIFTAFLIASKTTGSSRSISSLPQNFRALKEEHDEKIKSIKNIAKYLLTFR
jgi:delta-aminolevulinic acid dehydratase/porphobilinogen synthase